MSLTTARGARLLIAGVALCALLAAPGCDWLKGSGPGTRTSPFLSSLSVSPVGGVFCGPGNAFTLSFRYDDPQDDIFELSVTLVHAASQSTIAEQVLWSGVDLSVAGRARYSYTFECGRPGGVWEVRVLVTDLEGHASNELTSSISLNSL